MSVYSALTALNVQQTKLDVIGNNLANVSTVAYKSQSVSFADLLSQTLSGSSAASSSSNTGGTNAQQVGLGVAVSGITTDTSTGSISSTGVDTDVAINGSGYFIVEGDTAGTYYFTRAGNFGVDSDGNLTVNGYKVCGWEPDSSGTIDTESAVSGINLFYTTDGTSKQVIAPEQTTYANMTGTLDSTADAQGASLVYIGSATDALTVSGKLASTASALSNSFTAYDVEGNSTDVSISLTVAAASGTVYDSDGNAVTQGYTVTWTDGTTSGTLYFDSSGNIMSGTYYSDSAATTTALTATTSGTITVANTTSSTADDTVTINFSDLKVNTSTGATSSLTVEADGGIDADMDTDAAAAITVYDALGNEYDVNVEFTKCYTGYVYDSSGNKISITTVYWSASDTSDNVNSSGSGYLAFDSEGKLLTGTYYSSDPTVSGASYETYTFDDSYDIDITAATNGSGNKAVNIDDFTVAMNLTSLALYTEGSVSVADSDGYASGTLTGYSISSDGTITGTYSNNQTQVLAQLGLAMFDNAAGLDKVGTSLYAASANSGAFTGAIVAGSEGTGTLTSGALESSNVDLSAQFAEMMVAERAYQAASKLITVTDDMAQTVINMVS